jgi:hypothetical protein
MGSVLGNRVRVTTATTGTGTITLGAAYSNAFLTFAEAGIADASVVRYCIEDGNDFEIGSGTYTLSGTTLTRTTVNVSKISGTQGTTKINLSGTANVRVVFANEDYSGLLPKSVLDGAILTSASNSNETLLAVDGVASAVNYLEITNAATGVGPSLSVASAGEVPLILSATNGGYWFAPGSDGPTDNLSTLVVWSSGSDPFSSPSAFTAAAISDDTLGDQVQFTSWGDDGSSFFSYLGDFSNYSKTTFFGDPVDFSGDLSAVVPILRLTPFDDGTTSVNYLEITNAATGVAPSLTPAGDVAGINMGANFVQVSEMSAPSAPAANGLRLFARDNGSGKTQLCAIANGGSAEVIWTQA